MMDRPKHYVELHLDLATVCTNGDRQAVILLEDVGAMTMYCVHAADYIQKQQGEDVAPELSHNLIATEFYGAALRRARAWCGWDWEPHPDKPEDLP